LGTYLSPEQMLATVEHAILQNITMLLLDNAAFDAPSNLTQYVIDKDFVVIKTNTAM